MKRLNNIFFIISLKKEFPKSKITLALEPRSKSVKDLTGVIDDLFLVDAKGKNKYFELLKLIFLARKGNFGKNFDIVISSNYVRAISTAKYFTKDKLFIDDNFGERKFGVNSWDELPSGFELRQNDDENYKIGDGESQKEVRERVYKALMKVIK